MKTAVEDVEKNKVRVVVEVPPERFDRAISKAYASIAQKVRIPGFRKGKVPARIIDINLGKEYIIKEAIEKALPDFYLEAVAKSGVRPVDKPQITLKQAEQGKPLIFDAMVQVEPQVKLKQYQGLSLTRRKVEVSNEEVDTQLAVIQERFAQLEISSKDKVEKGHYVLVDLDAHIGQARLEDGLAQDYLMEVGSGKHVREIEEALVGMERGQSKEIEVEFGPDHPHQKVVGKKATFKIGLKEIKEKSLPPLDDDFASQVGEFNTIDELRAFVRDQISSGREREAQNLLRAEAVDRLIENAEIDVPLVMIADKVEGWIRELSSDLEKRGEDLEKFLQTKGRTREQLRADYARRAEREVRRDLILDRIAELEKLEVDEQEVKEEARKISQTSEDNREQLYEYYTKDIGSAIIRRGLLREKALQLVIDQVDMKIEENKGEGENEDVQDV
ncbi:trigger factor [Candidatus Hakubella thermalkaliphila]|uniref:Trigger factor n=3 Tax=Candidatus Hakubella thermalkaliphila TaxID=2754717 RepID=A0A6V8PAL7_9ACTN|nr:trigger factor [Candidatus Hakubella thermalkaliphila]MBT9169900.1 Trigger factor [Actinomycetota bacterium]GFP18676.1 trigger factor [Candidatus Hakubella thermalkaliphila]GFP29328.1 trigger factor [Candidatus Hakubella thermalkaliphila]GFP36794.1 trigger factor [Candidatus Hakubella thermalkaliphila]GFP39971.1 trigger factor [Candidatus Hakubella thermalkaliphila]